MSIYCLLSWKKTDNVLGPSLNNWLSKKYFCILPICWKIAPCDFGTNQRALLQIFRYNLEPVLVYKRKELNWIEARTWHHQLQGEARLIWFRSQHKLLAESRSLWPRTTKFDTARRGLKRQLRLLPHLRKIHLLIWNHFFTVTKKGHYGHCTYYLKSIQRSTTFPFSIFVLMSFDFLGISCNIFYIFIVKTQYFVCSRSFIVKGV